MPQKPELSILILTFRDGPLLLKSIHNLLHSEIDIALEWIIIDVDSSLQESERAQLESLSEKILLKVLRSAENHLSRNRNLALKAAQADWVLFVDADAELTIDLLRGLWSEKCELQNRDSRFSALGASNVPPQEESKLYRYQYLFQKQFWGHLRSPQMWLPKVTTRVKHLSTVCAIFRKSDLVEAGYFSPSFPVVCEDLEMGLRLSQRGKHLYLSSRSCIVHRSEGTLLGWLRRCFRFGMGQVEVYRRYPNLLLSMKGVILSLVCMLGFATLFWPMLALKLVVMDLFFCVITTKTSAGDSVARTQILKLAVFALFSHLLYGSGLVFGILKFLAQPIRQGARKKSDLSHDVVTQVT